MQERWTNVNCMLVLTTANGQSSNEPKIIGEWAIVEPDVIGTKWAIVEPAIAEPAIVEPAIVEPTIVGKWAITEPEIVGKWAITEPEIVGKWEIVKVAENIKTVSLIPKHISKGRKFRTKAATILYGFHD